MDTNIDESRAKFTTSGLRNRKDALLNRVDFVRKHIPRRKRFWFFSLVVAIVGTLLVLQYFHLHTPPEAFPTKTPIVIEEGSSLSEIATELESLQVVRSALFFQFILKATLGDAHVRAETYYFDEPLRVEEVAEALVFGSYTLPPVRLVIPEGLRIDQIDALVASQFENIAPGEFSEAAHGLEGYLFPDTYYATQSLTAPELVELMSKNFEEKVASIADDLTASELSLDEVVTMASIIEREAGDTESKHVVSGILWERIRIEMPLQVDAVFEYIYKESAATLTSEDLLIDSPYNTYKNRGLPPTPIVNPGLESILAALNPAPSPYLYYITGNDGNFYYAETFDEHKRNINAHLR